MSNQEIQTPADYSPSKAVWKIHLAKGIYPPHRVSKITCIYNQLLHDKVVGHIKELGIRIAYLENARNVRELVKTRVLLPGTVTTLEDSPVNILRFTIPRKFSQQVIESISNVAEFFIPGRGTILSQDLIEFAHIEPSEINFEALKLGKQDEESEPGRRRKRGEETGSKSESVMLRKLSYVICVLSEPGSGEFMAKVALDLGVCVPVVTHGRGTDLRDQLGLIRITISPDKEVVHLIMPEQDSESIIKLLIEQGRLDRPGRGFIYQTPVSWGIVDTRLKIGKQTAAASMEQIIAAIDQIKGSTTWRKRLDAESHETAVKSSYMPQDNCELAITAEEDKIDDFISACMKVGAAGATTSRIVPIMENDDEVTSTMVRSAISVPANMVESVVGVLLENSTINKDNIQRIHVLDSPAAYVHTF